MTVIEIIKLGRKYIKLWPELPELGQYFADYNAVQSCRFVCKYFPALALFTFIMQLFFSSGLPSGQGSITLALSALPQALVYGLFLLSMPVQALVIAGVKADKRLPPSLDSWYKDGIEKAKQSQQNHHEGYHSDRAFTGSDALQKLVVTNPRYIDLAKLLRLTFDTSAK